MQDIYLNQTEVDDLEILLLEHTNNPNLILLGRLLQENNEIVLIVT